MRDIPCFRDPKPQVEHARQRISAQRLAITAFGRQQGLRRAHVVHWPEKAASGSRTSDSTIDACELTSTAATSAMLWRKESRRSSAHTH